MKDVLNEEDYLIPQHIRYSNLHVYKSLQPWFVRSTIRATSGLTEAEEFCGRAGMLCHTLRHRTAMTCVNRIAQRKQEEMLKQFALSLKSEPVSPSETNALVFYPELCATSRPETAVENSKKTIQDRPFTASKESTSSLQQQILLAHHDWTVKPKMRLAKLFKELKKHTLSNTELHSKPGRKVHIKEINSNKTSFAEPYLKENAKSKSYFNNT